MHNAHGGGHAHIAHMPHVHPHHNDEGVLLYTPADPETWCQDVNGNWHPCDSFTQSLSLSPQASPLSSVGWYSQKLDAPPRLVRNAGLASVAGLLTTADDVRNAKLALDPQMVATNRQWESVSLGNPANNPMFSQAAANDSFAWDQFFDTWNTFVITDSSFFGANDDMARLNDFASELQEWQARLTTDTQNSPGGPITPILKATPPAQPPPPDNPLSPLVWIAGFAVAGLLLVDVAPFLHAVAPRRRYAR